MRRTELVRNLAIPRTTLMPHPSRVSDGTLRFSYPQTLSGYASACRVCRRKRASASLSEAFGSAAFPIVSHRRRTVRHKPYLDPRTMSYTRLSPTSIPCAICDAGPARILLAPLSLRHIVPLGAAESSSRMSGKVMDSGLGTKPHHPAMNDRYYQNMKHAAHRIYTAQPVIQSPFIQRRDCLRPEGFHHLSRAAHG